VEDGAIWIASESKPSTRLKLGSASAFDVGCERGIEIAVGDKILIRANDRQRGLINGQVLTVEHVEPNRTIRTREGTAIPATFRHWCHGYVVTSHKAQGRTCEHVVVAAEKLDAKAAYVACSRGRRTCSIHTPDKERLMERLPEGNRTAALDAIENARGPKVATSILRRPELWRKIAPAMIKRSAVSVQRWIQNQLEQARQTVLRWNQLQTRLKQSRQVAPRQEQQRPPVSRGLRH
jgi:hypothetical protein